jgi:hypothetical protein
MKINLQTFKDLLLSKGEKGEELAKKLIIEHDFKQIKLSSEETIEFDGEKIGKDMEVFLVEETGKKPLPQGEYQTESGYRFTVNEQGVVTKVDEELVSDEKMQAIEQKMSEMTASIAELKKHLEQINTFTSQSFKDLAKAIEPEPDGGNEPEPAKHEFKNKKLHNLIERLQK